MPGFEVIKEGFAKAQFGFVPENMPLEKGSKPFSFEVEGDGQEQSSDEFYVKLFRCLSAGTTQSRFFDFSTPGVLKKAVSFFENVTIFANHRNDVTQWKGFTKNAVWDGKNEPNGINAQFVLDRTVDPALVRGVEIGALRSASATVWFKYQKSHPDLKWFYDHLGTEVDGEIVRFIVTEIQNVGEMSIVWEGEDRHAKSFEAGEHPETQEQFNHGENEMPFTDAFKKKLSIGENDSTEAVEFAAIERITGLETQVNELKADAEIGKQLLSDTRQKAVTLYKAAKGEAAKESFITNVIETANLETAKSFVDEYQTAAEDAFPLACPKCGETLARRSSKPGESEGNKADIDISNFKIS